MSVLLMLAAPAAGLVGEEVQAEDAVGFKTFERYCLDAKAWRDAPDLDQVAEGGLSSLESRAFSSSPGGPFRVFLASAEPRVLLGLQWDEMQANRVVFRNGRVDESQKAPVTLIGGRCIVFAHEDVWQGMPEAFERATGMVPRDISNEDGSFDGLMAIDTDAISRSADQPRANTFGVTRSDGTTMYRAIM